MLLVFFEHLEMKIFFANNGGLRSSLMGGVHGNGLCSANSLITLQARKKIRQVGVLPEDMVDLHERGYTWLLFSSSKEWVGKI